MGVIADKLRDLQKAYKENNYAEYDQILDFAIEIADSEENKQCKWYVTHTPYGFPFYATECGTAMLVARKLRLLMIRKQVKTISKDYDCSCWNDYPNEMHRYRGQKPYKSGKWKCVDCYEYVGKSKFGATHCRKKATN